MEMNTTSTELSPEAPPRRRITRFTHVLRGRFALLFVFLLASIVVYPYAEVSGLGFYAFRVLGVLVLVLTLYAVTFSRHVFVLLLVLAVPNLVQHVILHQHSTGTLALASRLLSMMFNVLVIAIIFRHVFRTDRPNTETIFGALCVYLLVGFAFANFYAVLENYYPQAFYLTPNLNVRASPDRFDFVYYSFGTLTELGNPGISAVLPLARSLSLLEAITGILYLAVLISRLLSAYRSVEETLEQRRASNIQNP